MGLHFCLSSVHYCKDRFHIHFFNRSSNMTSIYSQPFIPNAIITLLMTGFLPKKTKAKTKTAGIYTNISAITTEKIKTAS